MLRVPMSPLGSLLGCSRLCPPTLLQFLDQENQMSRTQLQEVEARLKATQATLQERTLQCEQRMESYQRLRYCPFTSSTQTPLLLGNQALPGASEGTL